MADRKEDKVDDTKDLKKQNKELENNWKRALADYKNLEKRVSEERIEIISFANLVLITKLVIVLDNLEMLNQHTDDEGLKLILKEFRQILTDEGLEEIEAESEDFDETIMEAIEMVDGKENTVIEVIQKGYKLKNKIIRPAKVKVGKNKGGIS